MDEMDPAQFVTPNSMDEFGRTESAEWCQMVYDGTDTDDTVWNRCTVHDHLVVDSAYVCEGYRAPDYKEKP